jgi:hypothetical protein
MKKKLIKHMFGWKDVANMASYAICSEFDFGDSWQHDHWD